MAVAGTEGGFGPGLRGPGRAVAVARLCGRVVHEGGGVHGHDPCGGGLRDDEFAQSGTAGGDLWPAIFATGQEIAFAHTSFKWANLASHNAGVTVSVVGMSNEGGRVRRLYSIGEDGETIQKETGNINAYLVAAANVVVRKASEPLTGLADMSFGNKPVDGGNLLLTRDEVAELGLTPEQEARFIRRIYGSREFIRGESRYCLWDRGQGPGRGTGHPGNPRAG